ncbi:hypothetical protein K8Q93_02915 [Candidatus Parcubacteria bacterium]|nr:hypothetical protein [Candidatus Parcubacteria bacterium]
MTTVTARRWRAVTSPERKEFKRIALRVAKEFGCPYWDLDYYVSEICKEGARRRAEQQKRRTIKKKSKPKTETWKEKEKIQVQIAAERKEEDKWKKFLFQASRGEVPMLTDDDGNLLCELPPLQSEEEPASLPRRHLEPRRNAPRRKPQQRKDNSQQLAFF